MSSGVMAADGTPTVSFEVVSLSHARLRRPAFSRLETAVVPGKPGYPYSVGQASLIGG